MDYIDCSEKLYDNPVRAKNSSQRMRISGCICMSGGAPEAFPSMESPFAMALSVEIFRVSSDEIFSASFVKAL